MSKVSDYCNTYFDDFFAYTKKNGGNWLFLMAQTAVESGWGENAIALYNLAGITATPTQKNKILVRTTEYHYDNKQGHLYVKVYSIIKIRQGRYMYDVDRWFATYDTLDEFLNAHFKILQSPRYKAANKWKHDVKCYAYEVAKAGYCTADPSIYADLVYKCSKMIVAELKKQGKI